MAVDRLRWRQRIVGAVLVAIVVLTGSSNAVAQSTFAALTGAVTDPSAAVVPGATVVATNTATGVARSVVTDATGAFQIPNIDAGRYRIVVTLQVFQDGAREVELLARQTVRVDLQLQMAGATERVDVTASAP